MSQKKKRKPMMKLIFAIIFLVAASSLSFAADFAPTLLTVTAPPVIEHVFDGSNLEIPVEVAGHTALFIFSVFTNGKAAAIPYTNNGYLGWHHVNRVDTCVYFSSPISVNPGIEIIDWDGRDQDGTLLENDNYTYYIWAFDNQGAKEMVCDKLHTGEGFDYISDIRENDTKGLPLANPIWYNCLYDSESITTTIQQWEIGSDPYNEDLLRTSVVPLPEGWRHRGDPLMQPDDMDNFILSVGYADSLMGSMLKYRFVPDGEAEPVTGWGGEAPFATKFSTAGGSSAGVTSDGDYLYTTDSNISSSNEPDSEFYIYDMEGGLIEEIDLSPWWSSQDDYDAGGQMNGGPLNFEERNGVIFLSSHSSCLAQMIDPKRYLDSGDYDDLFVWTNGNGDYTRDHNFEDTATRPWTCNDDTVGPLIYSVSADDNLFSISNAYDVGAVSFSMCAPDGTGLGFYSFAGETAGRKTGQKIIDGGTPFDGIYSDAGNTYRISKPTAPSYSWRPPRTTGIFFIGHDSFRGEIKLRAEYINFSKLITGNSYYQGDTIAMSWNSRGIETIDIEFSSDNGVTWETVKYDYPASSSEYSFPAPDVSSSNCIIRISDSSGKGFTSQSDNFKIIGPYVSITAPSGSYARTTGSLMNIKWSSALIEKVSLEFSLDEGAAWNSIVKRFDSSIGQYEWRLPKIETNNAYVRIYDSDRPQYISTSTRFILITPHLTLESPNGGEELTPGEWYAVKWSYYGANQALLEYTVDGGETWSQILRASANARSRFWLVPDLPSENCLIRIRNEDNPDLYDISDAPFTIIGDVAVDSMEPHKFTLSQNSPNPFNPITSIPFTLPKESSVTLTIFSITGEKVAELVDGTLGAGNHSVDWDASGVGSGMYLARLKAGENVETVKMTVVK